MKNVEIIKFDHPTLFTGSMARVKATNEEDKTVIVDFLFDGNALFFDIKTEAGESIVSNQLFDIRRSFGMQGSKGSTDDSTLIITTDEDGHVNIGLNNNHFPEVIYNLSALTKMKLGLELLWFNTYKLDGNLDTRHCFELNDVSFKLTSNQLLNL